MSQLADSFKREFSYLRLSLTDVCNFRCSYCLPDGYQSSHRHTFLTLDEIRLLTNTFADFGVKKIRLTGGEPTLRRDFTDIVALVRENKAIKTLAVTTNGYRLAKEAQNWRNAGLTAINVSVDSLKAAQFYSITGQDKFNQVMQGIDAAFTAGFAQVKVNAVLMKGVNDQELPLFLQWIKHRSIQLRFIELMETGSGRDNFRQYHVSGRVIQKQLEAQGWQLQAKTIHSGPALVFAHPDYLGQIGLIMPYSKDFCSTCNRLRVSSIGHLHLCLFGENGIPLRDLLVDSSQQDELKQRIRQSLETKRPTHFLHDNDVGMTQNLSFIGG